MSFIKSNNPIHIRILTVIAVLSGMLIIKHGGQVLFEEISYRAVYFLTGNLFVNSNSVVIIHAADRAWGQVNTECPHAC